MQTRRAHTWKPNKASIRPQHVIFVDTETVPVPRGSGFDQHILKLGWCCYLRPNERSQPRNPQWLYFTTIEDFWDFVEGRLKAHRKLYLVGHGMTYDVGVLQSVKTTKARGWKETFSYQKGSNLIARYKTGKGTLLILSTTNFFNMSLKDLGALVGLPKGKVDFKRVSDADLKAYCKRDVEIVIRAWGMWLEFLTLHDLGNFKSTIASQAFTGYRHRFMPREVWVHGNMAACELERDSYRGGRCEVFRQGEFPTGEYYKLDVNGLYGYIMSTHKLPYDLYGHRGRVELPLLKHYLKKYAVVARVVISIPLPVFPTKRNGVNCYQTGTFETTLTTPELKFALEHGDILEVKEIAWYKQDYILQDYANYFAKLKEQYSKQGNMAFRKIAKLFNNALYGKLAQRDYTDKRKDERGKIEGIGLDRNGRGAIKRELKRGICRAWDKWGMIVWGNPEPHEYYPNEKAERVEEWSFTELLGKKPKMRYTVYQGDRLRGTNTVTRSEGWISKTEAKDQHGESRDSFPAISAHVTAYARMFLWDLMVKAGRENVFYCDTDGFICNAEGYENVKNLLDDHKEGRLKIEAQATELTILRRKGYILGGARTIGGIRKNAVELAPLEFEQDQFLGAKGAIRKGNPDLRGISRVVKRVSTEIKGGVVGEDGWIIPFHLPL